MSETPVQRWIAAVAPGRSFVDIGGIGEKAVNERVSQAIAAGAARTAMADIEPADAELWRCFRERMAAFGIAPDAYERHAAVDITKPDLAKRLSGFEVVHCTGILYHCPDPVTALHNLRSVTGQWLIINTVICPERLENPAGTLTLPAGGALFLPSLSEAERAVLRLHYRTKFGPIPNGDLNYVAPRPRTPDAEMPHLTEGGQLSCLPWWWLFTTHAFRSLLHMLRLDIRDEWTWENHAHCVLCEQAP